MLIKIALGFIVLAVLFFGWSLCRVSAMADRQE